MSSAFKTLKQSDVTIVPYTANKQWSIASASLSSYNITVFQGLNTPIQGYGGVNPSGLADYVGSGPIFNPSTFATTTNGEYKALVYRSIKQLYYQNYLTSSWLQSSSSYDNYDASTAGYGTGNEVKKYFPTGSNETIQILSIPYNIFGNNIVPTSFTVNSSAYNVVDDGDGNLYDSNVLVGNIAYSHGLAIITNQLYQNIFTSSFNLAFKGDNTIYNNEVRCHINENDFNMSLNPSILSDGSGSMYSFATQSYFHPYATSIGLYNDTNELLAVAKFSTPIPIPSNTDITFVVKFDT